MTFWNTQTYCPTEYGFAWNIFVIILPPLSHLCLCCISPAQLIQLLLSSNCFLHKCIRRCILSFIFRIDESQGRRSLSLSLSLSLCLLTSWKDCSSLLSAVCYCTLLPLAADICPSLSYTSSNIPWAYSLAFSSASPLVHTFVDGRSSNAFVQCGIFSWVLLSGPQQRFSNYQIGRSSDNHIVISSALSRNHKFPPPRLSDMVRLPPILWNDQ